MSSSKLISVTIAVFLTLSSAIQLSSIYNFRPMSPKDFDAVTDTLVDAFDPGEIWTYIYQFRDRLPEYHWRCFREQLDDQYPRMSPLTYANVIVPLWSSNTEVQSFAVWKNMTRGSTGSNAMSSPSFGWPLPDDLTTDQATNGPDSIESVRRDLVGDGQVSFKAGLPGIKLPCSLHLDWNYIRAAHLAPQLQAAEKKYIEDEYEHQLYLSLLATHPDWDGNGFGAAQVEWGMERARAEGQWLSLLHSRQIRVPVTLLATPVGYPLYKSLGFESVANVTFTLIDSFEGSTTWFEYMRWFSDEELPLDL